jgi:hypothetical protein
VASELGKYNNKPVPETGFIAGQIEAPYAFRSDQGMILTRLADIA